MAYSGKYIFILDHHNDPKYLPGYWVATPEAKNTRSEILAITQYNTEQDAISIAGLDRAFAGHHEMMSVQEGRMRRGKIYKLRGE